MSIGMASESQGISMLDRTDFFLRQRLSAPPAAAVATTPPRQEHTSGRSPTNDDGHVGRRIKELRRRLGMTQKVLAHRVGVTGAQLHRYEVGATRVAASRLIAIASALEVRPEALISDTSPQISAAPALGDSSPSDDLVELVEIFSSLRDERQRAVMLRFVRALAARPAEPEQQTAG